MAARVFQRFQHGGAGVRVGEVRTGHRQRAGGGDVLFVDILRRERHVGAIVTIENERERLLIFNAEHHQRRQPLFIGDQVFGIDACARQRFTQEASVMFIPHAGQHRRFQPLDRGAERDIA